MFYQQKDTETSGISVDTVKKDLAAEKRSTNLTAEAG